jgi:hypothetical protein
MASETLVFLGYQAGLLAPATLIQGFIRIKLWRSETHTPILHGAFANASSQ